MIDRKEIRMKQGITWEDNERQYQTGRKPEINEKNLEGHNQTWDNMRKTVEK